MSDLLLAILLLVGGAAGPIAFVIGFVWLGYIVLGWLA